MRDDVLALLPGILRPPGRPPAQRSAPEEPADTAALSREVLRFLIDHPGCVCGGVDRRRYSDGFRHRVLELRERFAELDLGFIAEAVQVPLGTLTDWLRLGRQPPLEQCSTVIDRDADADDEGAPDSKLAKVEAVLEAWRGWHGGFTSFCEHVRCNLRLDFGDTMISSILFVYGKRKPRRRRGRAPDEEAIRKAFLTYFPNAQWVGDGTEIVVTIDDQEHRFNFELIVDAFSGAFVGTSVRDTEDSRAVTEAFAQGVATTEGSPLALLLDNKPSNHSDDVDQATGDTLRIRSTPWRPQNKAHVEGAFGLFSQYVSPLMLQTGDPRELGRQLVRIVVDLFARVLNHRPRRDRDGKSRADLHQQTISDEEREKARAALAERLRKQEAARAAREARMDPAVRGLLDAAFDELGLLDPERFYRGAIARYPLDAIVDSIAIFKGKLEAGTLPDGVDARYLLGIVRNLHHVHESDAITTALLHERLGARDRMLQTLGCERAEILRDEGPGALLVFVDRALGTDRTIDQFFWADAAAKLISDHPHDERSALFRSAARRIHTTFRATRHARYELERILARRLWPLS